MIRKAKKTLLPLLTIMVLVINVKAQSAADSTVKKTEKKYQSKPPETQTFGAEAFTKSKKPLCAGWVWRAF